MIRGGRSSQLFPVWLPDRPDPRQLSARYRLRLHPMAGAMVVAVLLTLPAVLYVSQRAYRAEAGYEILRLQKQLADLREEHARLSSQAAALKSLQRIEHVARTKLNMAPPRLRQLIAITIRPAMANAVELPERRSMLSQLLSWLGRSEAEARERVR